MEEATYRLCSKLTFPFILELQLPLRIQDLLRYGTSPRASSFKSRERQLLGYNNRYFNAGNYNFEPKDHLQIIIQPNFLCELITQLDDQLLQ